MEFANHTKSTIILDFIFAYVANITSILFFNSFKLMFSVLSIPHEGLPLVFLIWQAYE